MGVLRAIDWRRAAGLDKRKKSNPTISNRQNSMRFTAVLIPFISGVLRNVGQLSLTVSRIELGTAPTSPHLLRGEEGTEERDRSTLNPCYDIICVESK